MPRKVSASLPSVPHSWAIENWPAGIYPGSASRGRYVVRMMYGPDNIQPERHQRHRILVERGRSTCTALSMAATLTGTTTLPTT